MADGVDTTEGRNRTDRTGGTGEVLVGIDVGTSVAKATAFTADGRVVAERVCPVALDRPAPGHVEQDTGRLLTAVGEVVAGVIAAAGRTPAAVGVTAQGDGLWLTDDDGRPTRPGVSWLDARAADVVARWDAEGVSRRLWERTGTAVFPGLQAPLLAWFDEHDPAPLDAATTAGYVKDVVLTALTGVRATDVTDASAVFGRPPGATGAASGPGGYDPDLLDRCGLGHRADLLAPVAATGLPTGTTTGRFALPAGVPVSSGPYDLAACAAGAGVEHPGDGLLILGTTLACLVPTAFDGPDAPAPGALPGGGEPAGLLLRLPGEAGAERFLRCMPAMVGTAGLDWVLELVGVEHAALGDLLADSPPGADGVRALPFFATAGERAPFVDARARAQLVGVSATTGRADLVRAVCEALAFAARRCLDAAGLAPDGQVTVCGGGSRSRAWLQIVADVLDRPVHLASVAQVGARGAVLAGLRHGDLAPELQAATADWELTAGIVAPDPARTAHYDAAYADYLADEREARARWHR